MGRKAGAGERLAAPHDGPGMFPPLGLPVCMREEGLVFVLVPEGEVNGWRYGVIGLAALGFVIEALWLLLGDPR